MDLVYTTVWETAKKSQRDVCGKVTVSWSHRNLIAFTTGYKKVQHSYDKTYLSNAIHILDPDLPWDVCSFDSKHNEMIQKILWDSTGSRLLSIDSGGQCKVWTMRENLINDWQCETTANVGEGECISAVSWIDNGIKVMFSPSSPDDHTNKRSFEEQFKSSSNKHPYTEFGGKAQDGWVSVTESGLFCVTTLKPNVKIARQSLSSIRQRLAFADLAYTNQGKVIVAANDGGKCTSVQFYRVQIKPSPNNTCQIETFSLPCLFPHSRSELEQLSEYRVADIQFVSKNSCEVVLVCTVGPFGTCIKRWIMRKERIEKFQKVPFRATTQPTIHRWSCLTSHMDRAQVISLALPRLCVTGDVSQSMVFPVMAIAASYEDDRIVLINSHSLLPISSYQTQAKGLQSTEPVAKKTKIHHTQQIGVMSCMSFSPCSCCLVGVSTTGDMSLFKVQPGDGTLPNRLKRSLADLLEYCLVAGWEWWDIMVATHLGAPADMAESVLKQLLDDFSHTQLLHQYTPHMLVPKLMALKAGLYRCMKDGSGQAMDCYAAQFLYAVTILFRSLPSCTQNNNMEQLTKACTLRTTEIDVDKIILSVDSKEYTVEAGTLTAVHPLIQWITDLAMFIIAAFTTRHTKDSVPGVSLGRNPEVLGLLKEMLVLIRIWGQSVPSIVPSITPSADKKDSLALLFKIITKMWLHSKQPGEGQEIEDRLAAEASPLLPNQLFILNMKAPNLNRGVVGKPVSGPVKASIYQFNNRPIGSSVCHSYHPFASAVLPIAPESAYTLDVIRRVFIDSEPDVQLKQCTRCSCVSQLTGLPNQNITLKTWEQRWVKSCVCGGSWKKYNAQGTAV